MKYIEELKSKNIKFEKISEEEAYFIITNEYSYFKLIEYTNVFDKYHKGDRKGEFINLDFSMLYHLCQIDEKLSHIIICLCLEIEQSLKAIFTNDVLNTCDENIFLNEYINQDYEYLSQTYTADNFSIITEKYNVKELKELTFSQFIDVIQFGTFERLMHYFYKNNANVIYNSVFAPFEKQLSSMKKMRNMSAHNNSILSELMVKRDFKDHGVSSFLGKNGIRHKTLNTNMKKYVVYDFSNLLYLFFNTVRKEKKEIYIDVLEKFLNEFCLLYKDDYINNALLMSVYNFIRDSLKVYKSAIL